MFHKLRLKLTLINVIIMALLFLLFTIGTYFVVQMQLFAQSDKLMQMIATNAGSGSVQVPDHDRNRVNYFVVKTDTAGTVVDVSSDISLKPDQLGSLVQDVLRKSHSRGEISWLEESYTYLKVKQNNNFMLVFVNVERERDFLGFLLITLAVIGVVTLALAFYASLFIANKAMQPIQSSWQRQKDFVADASHELRTPLAVIQTNVELVRGNEEETVGSQAHWLENIQLETKRLTKLVDDLLFLARADSDQQLMDMKVFPLHTALLEAVNPFKPLAESKQIKLEASLDAEIMLYGDENRLKQVVIILVDNALKHTPGGGQIGVRLRDVNNLIQISVWDTGEGVEPEHTDKIFERFYRVDKARSRDEDGSGLGLSIAEWIVKSHEGSIQVLSSPGQGCTFIVNIPRIKDNRKSS